MLERLHRDLTQRQGRLDSLLNITTRQLTAAEDAEYRTLVGDGPGSIPALRIEIETRTAADRAAALAQPGMVLAAGGRASGIVLREPSTYTGRHDGPSYFKDMAQLAVRGFDPAASERMTRHAREVAGQRQERALNTTDGTGGDFVPPMWMVDQFVAATRGARVTADRMMPMTLPSGTDSINIPKISTGTTIAEQGTQNTAVSNTDATTSTVTAAVATYAGQQVISLQAIEQSPINMDQVLLQDLAADYALKLDAALISNNATSKKGVLNVTGINAVSYTDGTPTVAEAYPKIADAIQQVHTNRFLSPDAIVMHPRRWAWFLAAVDTNGRPFVTPDAQGPFNGVAQMGAPSSEGYVGRLQGLPVYVDPSIPINLGAGTNEDRIVIGRFADALLLEGTPNAEVFRETKADQLSVLLRFYAYCAWTFERLPKAFTVISGNGLVTPVF